MKLARSRSLRLPALALGVLPACGAPLADATVAAPDPALLAEGLARTSPEPWVELVDETGLFTGDLSACPGAERMEELDAEGAVLSVRETWTGPCELADGTELSGRLVRFEDEVVSWVAGQSFELRRDGELLLFLDGAVEITGQADLLLLDAAATACGAAADCEAGLDTVDLTWTLFPAHGYPDAYDVTVSGVVASGEAPLRIEGTWSVDVAACGTEPASGTIAVERGERHAVELDGLQDCDACAAWVVQGEELSTYCGLPL